MKRKADSLLKRLVELSSKENSTAVVTPKGLKDTGGEGVQQVYSGVRPLKLKGTTIRAHVPQIVELIYHRLVDLVGPQDGVHKDLSIQIQETPERLRE